MLRTTNGSNSEDGFSIALTELEKALSARKPTAHVGIQGIARNNHRVSTAAFLAVERPVFESRMSRLRVRMKHAGFTALWAARPIDTGKIGGGNWLVNVHNASRLRRERYRALCHRKRPLAVGDVASCHVPGATP
jgi:hypothetical protein